MKNLRPLIFVLFILWLFSPDKQLFAVGAALLVFLVRYSWRENEPKFVFIGMVFYWLTVCTLMVYGLVFNIPMVNLTLTPDTFIYTTYLALIATFCYCSGMLISVGKMKRITVLFLINELEKYDGKKLLLFYCLYSSFSSTIASSIFNSGLGQLGVGLVWMKWSFLTILIVHTLLFPANQKWVYFVLFVEVLLSFTGFWSSFKDYLFIAAGAFLTFSAFINAKKVLLISAISAVTFFLMVIWTVVKGEYRQYLTGGKRTQIIEHQDSFENLRKLMNLVEQDFDNGNFKENFLVGVGALANRINYTEYFAMSVAQVPAVLPYEKGALLMGGFEHIFKPRIFFPNKKSIDDSEMTSKYTGRRFAGAEYGASFSLGQVAERYIDYGPFWMFVPIFLFGVLIGVVYRYIAEHSLNYVWGLCCVAPLFFLIPSLGVATTKFLGWLFTYFIVWFLFNKYLLRWVDRFLRKSEVAMPFDSNTVSV